MRPDLRKENPLARSILPLWKSLLARLIYLVVREAIEKMGKRQLQPVKRSVILRNPGSYALLCSVLATTYAIS